MCSKRRVVQDADMELDEGTDSRSVIVCALSNTLFPDFHKQANTSLAQ